MLPHCLLATFMCCVEPAGFAVAAEPQRPNILFIMIDDLGWMDLACQGNALVDTPHIDRLATQGMRFTNAYAAAPVCSPTRAAALTGLAPARLHITNHLPDQERFIPDEPKLLPAPVVSHLELEYDTLAERMGEAGYTSGFIGKWHLAERDNTQFFPEAQGFQLNVGGCSFGGPPTFFDPYRIPTLPDRQPGEYLPDRLADESINFMRAHHSDPFLLCLWPYTVHWPMEAPEALLEKYAERKGPGLNDTRYGAMIEAMDQAVGRVLGELDRLELTNQTLVIFTSDNGGYDGVSDCRPLRESKGYLYEGGIRVPMIVRWPGQVEAGSINATPVVSMDYYPTFLAAAGVPPEPEMTLDGVNLLPLLTGEAELERDQLYFHYPNYAFHRNNRLGGAVRSGSYKLIENFDDGSLELYDLTHDIGETQNLATDKPEVAKRLQNDLRAWRESVGANMPLPVKPSPSAP